MTKENKDLVTQALGAGELTLPEGMGGMFDLKKNMEGITPRLPQIDIIHKGQMFKMPDGRKEDFFVGIILHQTKANAWWKVSYDETGGGEPPTCSSLDGVTPDMNSEDPQSDSCLRCPHNKFGSDGKGKECKNMIRLHVSLETNPTPHRISLPPSNLKAIENYIADVTLKGVPFQLIVAKFSLKEAQNKGGIEYSEIVVTPMSVVKDRQTAEMIQRTLRQWMPAFTSQGITSDEA